MTTNIFFYTLLLIISKSVHADHVNENVSNLASMLRSKSTLKRNARDANLATAVVNSQVLTILNYQNTQVYIYSALSNENEYRLTPQKWVFYFVPIMMPVTIENQSDHWAFTVGNEIRMSLLLSNEDVQQSARNAIMKKYDQNITQYSQFWDVAPLMIDSLIAYIVRGTDLPVEGISPYKAIHPNQLIMTFQFPYSSEDSAGEVIKKLLSSEYEIKIAFYFAGFKQVTTNLISVNSDQLQSVLSKTIADGQSNNAQYIHRRQSASFIGQYTANVQNLIYSETPDANLSTIRASLEAQFTSLMQQALNNLKETKLQMEFYNQIWSSKDINPDMLTNEINKLFIYNETETKRHNFSDTYFDLNRTHMRSSSSSGSYEGGYNVYNVVGGSFKGSLSLSSSSLDNMATSSKNVFSLNEIQHALQQESIESEWTGQKWLPKSFDVYKLIDVADRLQIAIVAKQLIADKSNGAIFRTVSTMTNKPVVLTSRASTPTGVVQMYASSNLPPAPWLLCNGSAISRITFRRLFSVIGTQYGSGNNITTFNLPDFRGRFALGVDPSQLRVEQATILGVTGGKARHQLTVDQLPSHTHGTGTLSIRAGGGHNHNLYDPSHNHGGQTGDGPMGGSGRGMSSGGGSNDRERHTHSIPSGTTGIRIDAVGDHVHSLSGFVGSVGNNTEFMTISPYQTINYIIYSE